MDNGDGSFRRVDQSEVDRLREEAKQESSRMGYHRIDKVFSIGEEVQVKASRFKVRNIDWITGIMTLKLMPEKRF